MKQEIKYSVSFIKDADALTQAMLLRYVTYKTYYPGLTSSFEFPYETDVLDRRSIHLALYCEDGSFKELAGYCRLVLPEVYTGKYQDYILKKHPFYPEEQMNVKMFRLFFMKLLPEEDLKTVNTYFDALETDKKIYAETGRFIIKEKHRSIVLSSFFAQSIFATALALHMNFNFFSCDIHHAMFYKRLGLTPLEPGLRYSNAVFKRTDIIFGTNLEGKCVKGSSIDFLKRQLEVEHRITFPSAI